MKLKYNLLLLLFCFISLTHAQTLVQKIYFDFGPVDGVIGNATSGTDSNGNYWNNPSEPKATASSPLILINSQNKDTGYIFQIIENFSSTGGSSKGGLFNPSSTLLGDLAIPTANQDYFYVEGSSGHTGIFSLTNLDKSKAYKFYFFGSRTATENRTALYKVSGLNTDNGNLQTSGKDLGGTGYNANIDKMYTSNYIYPTAEGEISVEVIRQQGNFAHLNVMKVEEYEMPLVEASTISISGSNITVSGNTSQMKAEVAPSNAFISEITWSTNSQEVAWIDNEGVLHPVKNGTVTVTASITSGDKVISGSTDITITNQLTTLYLSGTATEQASNISSSIPMKMVTDSKGSVSNIFEIYTSIQENKSLAFYTTQDTSSASMYGAGSSNGSISEGGNAINTVVAGAVLITVDLNNNTYSIFPITELSLVGSATPNGWNVGSGLPLEYKGRGVWSKEVSLVKGSSSDPARFILALNKSWTYALKKVVDSENTLLSSLHADKYGFAIEDIGSNMNGGSYLVTIDLQNYIYNIQNTESNHFKISVMGSSVANGQGAENMHGYAYMYSQLLKQRYDNKIGDDWKTSNISVNGNNTINLLKRWDKDLLIDGSGYVMYGISLGNEGIHENGQQSFDQFKENMQLLIQKARDNNIIPVITNSYTRGDFNETN